MNKLFKKVGGFFGSRGFSSSAVTALIIGVIVVLNILMYTLTSAFGLYLYSPITNDYGITGATDELFAEAEKTGKKVTVTFCMAEDDLARHGTGAFVLETARAYEERYDFIELKFVNLLTKMDENGNIVDLSKYTSDLRGNETKLYTHSVIFSSGEGAEENYRVLTDTYSSAGFADFYTLDTKGTAYAYSGEEVLGSMIAWVLNKEHKVAYFTQNHGETIDVTFANMLSSAGYYVDVVNLRQQAVPDDAALVIISNPITDFERGKEGSGVYTELDRLQTYLKDGNGGRGGRLYVSVDPYADELPILEEFLSEWGIEIVGDEGEFGYVRDVIIDPTDAIAIDRMSFIATYGESEMAKKIVSNVRNYTESRVLLSQVSRLKLTGDAEALLLTSSDAIATRGGEEVDSTGSYIVAAYSERDEGDGAVSGVFVVPSALLTNADLLVANGYSNKEFLYSLFEEVFDANVGIYGTKSVMFDTGIVENLTQRTAIIYTVLILMIPTAIAVAAVVITVRRKNR